MFDGRVTMTVQLVTDAKRLQGHWWVLDDGEAPQAGGMTADESVGKAEVADDLNSSVAVVADELVEVVAALLDGDTDGTGRHDLENVGHG